jgi:signal transduction histidine kinase
MLRPRDHLPDFQARVLVVGSDAWRAELAATLLGAGMAVTDVDDVAVADDFLDLFQIAFFEAGHGDPLQAISALWWSTPNLPVVLCGDDIDPALDEAATDANIVVVSPAVPTAGRLRVLIDVITGPMQRDAAEVSRSVARAMGALCELTVDADGKRGSAVIGDAAVHIIAELFRADVVSVMLIDETGVLRTVANVGLDDVVGRAAPINGPGSHVLNTGAARLLLGDARRAQLASSSTAQAAMVAPIGRQGHPVRGVLSVSKSRKRAIFTPRDLEVCTAVSTLLGELLSRIDADREAATLQHQLVAAERLTSLGELAAGVVHDVASPLGAVRANVETLIGHLSDLRPLLEVVEEHNPQLSPMLEDLPSLLCETYEGLVRANDVIRQMKSMLRIGTGAGEDIDVSATVDSAVRMVRSRVNTPVVILADDHCHIRGVPIELLQVLTNLLTNAHDACAERTQKCRQTGERYRAEIGVAMRNDGDAVVIGIRDNGIGMSADVLNRMWDQLYTTKPVGLGTGLGLPVVRRIVAEHGGHIDVASQPGVGTEFRVIFPRLTTSLQPTLDPHELAH